MQRASRESVAYDYSRFDNRTRVRKAAEQSVPVKEVKTKPRARVFTFGNVVTYLMVLAVSGLIVFNYMQASMLSDQKAKLETQLDKLKTEETAMLTEQEKMFSLANIEAYAQQNLGMVKADKSQIEYVELSNPDTIKILKDGEEAADDVGYLQKFMKTFNIVVEYLN